MSIEALSLPGSPPAPEVPLRAFIAETVTGRVIQDIPFEPNPRWLYGINLGGTTQVAVPLGEVSKDDLRGLLDPWRFSLAVARGQQILQMGPLLTWAFNDNSEIPTVTLGGAGLLKLLTDKRLLLNPTWNGNNPAIDSADIVLSGLSLHTIGKRLIELPMQRAGAALPIVLPPDIAGTHSRIYEGYDLAYVGERLMQLARVDGGPEIELRPEYVDQTRSTVRWRLRIGEPNADPQLDGRIGRLDWPHVWDYRKALVHLSEDGDGSRQTSMRIERGNAMEESLIVGVHYDPLLTNAGWPALEDAGSSHASTADETVLDSWARAHVATHLRPTVTWSASVRVNGDDGHGRATGSPPIDQVECGNNAVLSVQGHRWLPDGDQPVRILAVSSGAQPGLATLTLQPIQGAAA